jgi:steroid delta-isomerase-like uncharacterized protein
MNRWVVAVFGFVLLAMVGNVSAQSADPKAIARRYFEEVLNKGDAAAIGAIIADDVVFRNPPYVIKGLDGFRKLVASLRATFPDLQFTLEDEFAEGDKVATRWVMRGTQSGPIEGRAGTGKKMEVTGMDIFLITGGKVREVWVNMDSMGQAQQLGWLPARAAP